MTASSLGLAALPALAQDEVPHGIYAGAAVGSAGVAYKDELGDTKFDFDANDVGYKFILGWRPLNWLAFEGNYVDLGSVNDKVGGTNVETKVNGWSASALGTVPLGNADLYARVGGINWNADVNAPNIGIKKSDSGWDLAYGVGARYRFQKAALNAEYERYDVSNWDKVDMISLGFTYSF
jgi:hypothetical protein